MDQPNEAPDAQPTLAGTWPACQVRRTSLVWSGQGKSYQTPALVQSPTRPDQTELLTCCCMCLHASDAGDMVFVREKKAEAHGSFHPFLKLGKRPDLTKPDLG